VAGMQAPVAEPRWGQARGLEGPIGSSWERLESAAASTRTVGWEGEPVGQHMTFKRAQLQKCSSAGGEKEGVEGGVGGGVGGG
jgi:hypothetical protein